MSDWPPSEGAGDGPPVRLPDAASHDTRWQYRIVDAGNGVTRRCFATALSYFGQRGWEPDNTHDKSERALENIRNGFLLFKKPVPADHEPDRAWTKRWTSGQVATAYNAAKGQ